MTFSVVAAPSNQIFEPRLPAQARRLGDLKDVGRALASSPSSAEGAGSYLRAARKQADHSMPVGDFGRAGRACWLPAHSHPSNPWVWPKRAMLGVFSIAPPLGRWSFR